MSPNVILLCASLAVASALTQTSPVPGVPSAIVSLHSLNKPEEGIRVRVPAAARYVGAERFALYGVADAEIHVFVEADAAKRVRKLYWVQFESYLPSRPDARYPYSEIDRPKTLWGKTFWVSASPSDTSTTPRAGGDREGVMRLLARSGYTLPPEMVNVRLVRLLDDPRDTGYGRKELMIIYAEDLAPTGKRLSQLQRDDQPTPEFQLLAQGVIDRAAKAVTVTFR